MLTCVLSCPRTLCLFQGVAGISFSFRVSAFSSLATVTIIFTINKQDYAQEGTPLGEVVPFILLREYQPKERSKGQVTPQAIQT